MSVRRRSAILDVHHCRADRSCKMLVIVIILISNSKRGRTNRTLSPAMVVADLQREPPRSRFIHRVSEASAPDQATRDCVLLHSFFCRILVYTRTLVPQPVSGSGS